jgi:hypothetical protein
VERLPNWPTVIAKRYRPTDAKDKERDKNSLDHYIIDSNNILSTKIWDRAA